MTRKAYLVMDRDYLYNDETFSPWFEDHICTAPIKVLPSRAEAEQLARELSAPRFRGLVLGDYTLDGVQELTHLKLPDFYRQLSDLLQNPSIVPKGKLSSDESWRDIEIPARLDDARLFQVMDLLSKIRFYEVIESTTTDPALLQEAEQTINKGVVDLDEYEIRTYTAPEAEISKAVSAFGLEFEPFDGGI